MKFIAKITLTTALMALGGCAAGTITSGPQVSSAGFSPAGSTEIGGHAYRVSTNAAKTMAQIESTQGNQNLINASILSAAVADTTGCAFVPGEIGTALRFGSDFPSRFTVRIACV